MSGLETNNHDHSVPAGQTPLDTDLSHPLMRVFNEGYQARKGGQRSSPYHGHSLEHWAHATGWVQCDLRMALDKAHDDARQQRQQKSRFSSSAAPDLRSMVPALSLKAHAGRISRRSIATELFREYQEACASPDDAESRGACRAIKNLASALGVWEEFAAMNDNPPEPDPRVMVPVETVADVNDAFSVLRDAMAKFPKAEV